MKYRLAPSVLSCDFARLGQEVAMLDASAADWIHVDVMDGVFVPNISIGLPVVKAIARHTQKPLDVHLMIVEPARYLESFKEAGASSISVHWEADPHIHRTLARIRELGCRAGVAINPHTPAQALEYLLPSIDLVCLMAVNPGFGGQRLIDTTYRKVRAIRSMIDASGLEICVEVDGGVTLENAGALIDEGADILVMGQAVFGSPDPLQTLASLRRVR